MARIGQIDDIPSGPAAQGPVRTSIWTAIHPRLLELIREHRSTLIFVNSRRLAERLAGALNELAGEPLVRAHHGSLARAQRIEIEDALKAGRIRGARRHLVARARHRHGRHRSRRPDRGAAVGGQRHAAHRPRRATRSARSSDGIIFPKFRGDLVACAAVTRAMHEGARRGDALPAQPARRARAADRRDGRRWSRGRSTSSSHAVRRAAPFAELEPRRSSRACSTCSRAAIRPTSSPSCGRASPGIASAARLTAREGARRVAIVNGGTIPDRGLYGVFLAGAATGPARASASSTKRWCSRAASARRSCSAPRRWRIEEITHDRVLVSPAPGEPGKMPFWKGDAAGPAARARPRDRRAGARAARDAAGGGGRSGCVAAARSRRAGRREPAAVPRRPGGGDRRACPTTARSSSSAAATSSATGASACSRRSAAACTRRGRWRVDARIRDRDAASTSRRCGPTTGSWSGSRTPTSRRTPRCCCPPSDEVEALVVRQLGGTALFAAQVPRGRGAGAAAARGAARAARTPLWQQRKRAADLLAVASRFGSFPDRCSRPTASACATSSTCRRSSRRCGRMEPRDDPRRDRRLARAVAVRRVAALRLRRQLSSTTATRRSPSGARRRCRSTRRSCASCSARPSCASCSTPTRSTTSSAAAAAATSSYRARTRDGVHDLLLRLGDLAARGDRRPRAMSTPAAGGRGARASPAGHRGPAWPAQARFVAVEDAAATATRSACRCRRACPRRCSSPCRDAARRPRAALRAHARAVHDRRVRRPVRPRRGRPPRRSLNELAAGGRLLEGEFRPGGTGREWCDAGRAADDAPAVAREAAPRGRAGRARGRSAVSSRPGRASSGAAPGLDALLDVIEQLQGAPLPRRSSRREILPARIERLPARRSRRADGGRRGRVGRRRAARRARRPGRAVPDRSPRPAAAGPHRRASFSERRARDRRAPRSATGASFFAALHEAAGGGYPGETVDALWDLVWAGARHQRHVSTRCARSRAPPRAPRPQARPGAALVVRSASRRWRRRPPRAAGRSSTARSAASVRQPSGPRRSRSSCSRATAS